jgi:hypothetical protein
MTDRLNGVTVIFNRDIRDDDAGPVIKAIKMIKGVATVKPVIVDSSAFNASWRAKQELIEKLHAFVSELSKDQ